MAKFEIAESITGRNEGGYANNPADSGGETYAGIARNYWPKWEGWKYLDVFKKEFVFTNKRNPTAKEINKAMSASSYIKEAISKFYKQNFWDVNKLDQINDQQIANTVYDFGVNSGTGRAAKYLQQALGVAQDSKIGPATLAAVNSIPPKITHNKFNSLRETFYRSIAKGNQAEFLRSWLSRLKPYQG